MIFIFQVNVTDENKVIRSSSQVPPSIILTSCNQAGDKTVSTIKKPVEVEVRNDQSSSSNGEQIAVAVEDSSNHKSGTNEAVVKSFSAVFSVGKKPPQDKLTKKEEKIKRKKDKSAAKKERKATKTLAIVLGNVSKI